MIFNKKFLVGLCNIIGVLLILAFILNLVMYFWAYFGQAPLPLFDVTNGVIAYYILLNKLATLVFFYVVMGTLAGLIKSSKLQEGLKK